MEANMYRVQELISFCDITAISTVPAKLSLNIYYLHQLLLKVCTEECGEVDLPGRESQTFILISQPLAYPVA